MVASMTPSPRPPRSIQVLRQTKARRRLNLIKNFNRALLSAKRRGNLNAASCRNSATSSEVNVAVLQTFRHKRRCRPENEAGRQFSTRRIQLGRVFSWRLIHPIISFVAAVFVVAALAVSADNFIIVQSSGFRNFGCNSSTCPVLVHVQLIT